MADNDTRVSSKARTAIPKVVGPKPGDRPCLPITDDRVKLERADEAHDPFEHFGEWSSDEDERLYRDL